MNKLVLSVIVGQPRFLQPLLELQLSHLSLWVHSNLPELHNNHALWLI